MGKCSVRGCKSNLLEPGRQTFSFPDAPEMFDKWCHAIGRPDLKPGRYARICVQHFTPDDIEKFHRVDGKLTNILMKRYKLIPGVIPSIIPGKSHLSHLQSEGTISVTNTVNSAKDQFINEIFLNDSEYEMDVKCEKNPITIPQSEGSYDILCICQVCESTDELIDISEKSNAYFRQELQKITYFEDDHVSSTLLKYICRQCGNKLEDMSTFRNQYEITYKKLLERIICMENYVPNVKVVLEAQENPPEDQELLSIPLKPSIDHESEVPESEDNDWANTENNQELKNEENVHEESLVVPETSEKKRKLRKCKICKKLLKNSYEGEKHKIMHMGDSVKPICKICNKKFSCDANLSRHIKTVHEHRRDHVCPICSKSFTQSGGLKGHMLVHSQASYECDVCYSVFKSLFYMKIHKYKHIPVEEQTDEMKKVLLRMKRGTTNMRKRKYIGRICPVCGKYLTTDAQLDGHMRVHTGEKPFECLTCGTCFRERSTLRTHMYQHTGEKPYKCKMCSAAFRQKTHLSGHMKLHTGEKPHKCLVCGKDFRVKWNLNDHMRLHTGEKPFHCRICPEKFTNARVLRDHYRKVHFRGEDLRTPGDIQRKLDEVLKDIPGNN